MTSAKCYKKIKVGDIVVLGINDIGFIVYYNHTHSRVRKYKCVDVSGKIPLIIANKYSLPLCEDFKIIKIIKKEIYGIHNETLNTQT